MVRYIVATMKRDFIRSVIKIMVYLVSWISLLAEDH